MTTAITRTLRVSANPDGTPYYDSKGEYVVKVGLSAVDFFENGTIIYVYDKKESEEYISKIENSSRKRKDRLSFEDVIKAQ